MEMLYSPSSPSSAASSDSIPSLNDPGASSEGDACPNISSSSTLVGVHEDEVVGEDGGSNNDEPSKDSILTLLGMRFLPTTPNAHHIPSSLASPITPMVGQSSTFAGASPSTNSLSSSFLAPSPLTPASSSLGLPTSFANPAMSGMSGSSSTGAFPYYSTSLLSPSSSSPPAVYTPPSPTMPSASGYHHQQHQHHHQYQHLQYQPSSASSYPLTSQLLYPQQPQQQYQQPQQYQIVPQQSYQQQQQQYQPQQHGSSGSFGFMPSQQLYIQAHLNSDADGDHHSFVEPLGVGHKRKADLALTDSILHHQHHHQHQPYQHQLHHSGDLTVAPHRRDHDGYGGHHHHHGQQYQHQHNGGHHHHHHHHQQQQPHHHQQQLVVAAKAKKRRVRKTWTERFQQLKEFKQRFGHCKVPKGWSEDPKLARWVCNMRQSKRMGKMKEERVRKLEELGFLWRCEQTGKVIWEEMIEKLKAFQARHGHCRVPVEWPEDPQLSAWVVYVRQRNRANNLSQEKVKELDAIQFVWTDVATATAASTAATTSSSGGQRRSDSSEADPGRPELLY